MDYDTEVTWDDEDKTADSGKGVKLFKVAEKTQKFLDCHFTSAVSNQARRQGKG